DQLWQEGMTVEPSPASGDSSAAPGCGHGGSSVNLHASRPVVLGTSERVGLRAYRAPEGTLSVVVMLHRRAASQPWNTCTNRYWSIGCATSETLERTSSP